MTSTNIPINVPIQDYSNSTNFDIYSTMYGYIKDTDNDVCAVLGQLCCIKSRTAFWVWVFYD